MSPGLDSNLRRQLASSFQQDVQAYAAHRPACPIEAVRWLAGASQRNVLDLGAGTGSLTAALASLGHHVVAAEPSGSMVDVLALNLRAAVVQARAESLPFGPEEFDIVTVADAFHWFDASSAVPEVARVLRPGGRLSLVWNTRVEAAGWPQQFGDLLRAAQPKGLTGAWGTDSVDSVIRSARFDQTERAEFAFTQPLGRTGLTGLAASRSYVIGLDERRRRELFDDIGRLFDEAAAGSRTIGLPYRAQCWRFTKQ